jgi:dTMP kinase
VLFRSIRQQLAGGEVGDAVFPALFAADRRDHLDRVVAPARRRGAWVLSDRYFLSSLAYQSAAVGFDAVWSLNAGFPAPDLCVMLDLPLDDCLARVEARGGVRERFETRERLREVEATYTRAIERCVDRGDRVVRIDARGTVDEVHARVWGAVWPG